MKDIVGDYRERFRLQRKALRRYTALLLVLAMITTLFVNWQLHSDGIAATAQYQCNQEEHTHTADCYTKVLVCGYEEGQPEDWNATFDDSASLDESIGVDAEDDGIALFSAEPEYIYVPHEHTDDCYQEVKTLTCLEEEHVHGDDCFDPEDGSLICEQFEHVHDDSCYTTDYELVCGLEDGELVEELNPAYTAVAAFEAPVAAKPVVVSPVIEAPIHYHTDDCYEEVLTCGLEEHHHTVNCLADPLADVEDESEWLAKTSTSLSGDWSADLLTVAQSQLGYTQSEKNFEVDADDGQTVRHYTRYGNDYGNDYGPWDVMFLSYCLKYADIPQSAIPQVSSVLSLHSQLRSALYNEETGSGYAMAQAIGHTIIEPTGSLVPLVEKGHDCAKMQGLALKNVAVRLINAKEKTVYEDFGELLFTHFGLSGPVILSASAHMARGEAGYTVKIDLKPALDEKTLDARILRDFSAAQNRDFENSLSALLPKSMIPVVIARSGIDPTQKVNSITKQQRRALLETIKCFSIPIACKAPVEDAIVTSGGVKVSEVNAKTMESKLIQGLYFAGELLDVDAYTGGFNLQIAWATGRLAGLSAAAKEFRSPEDAT